MPIKNRPTEDDLQEKALYDILQYKKIICITIIIIIVFALYTVNKIAFFHDPEFERLVRETKVNYWMYTTDEDKRHKPLEGIIWKSNLECVGKIYINFREYHIRDISDLIYFKNVESIHLAYSSAYDGDKSIYDDEHVLDNLYKIKDLKYLDDLQLYHLKLDDEDIENIKKMFPNARVIIE